MRPAGSPVAVEGWWAEKDAGLVWEGRDVGVWPPTVDGPSNTPRLRPVCGGLATSPEPMSISRGALLAPRDRVVVGGRRYLRSRASSSCPRSALGVADRRVR